MVRIRLPVPLQKLAHTEPEVVVTASEGMTIELAINVLESSYPKLGGTIRDPITQHRRPYLRFFAGGEDLSLLPMNTPLPPEVLSGQEPFMIVGAIAGG